MIDFKLGILSFFLFFLFCFLLFLIEKRRNSQVLFQFLEFLLLMTKFKSGNPQIVNWKYACLLRGASNFWNNPPNALWQIDLVVCRNKMFFLWNVFLYRGEICRWSCITHWSELLGPIRKVNNRLTGWAFAHLVNFVHLVNSTYPLPKIAHQVSYLAHRIIGTMIITNRQFRPKFV